MNEAFTMHTGYRHDDALRGAFNALAGAVFGIDFEPWYRRGLWNDQYVPFTLFDGNRAVANVSANLLDLVLDGVPRKAAQFGTVMTHEAYRNRGLARHLLLHAMEVLRDRCGLFYLMGDKDALGFYRKMEFEAIAESTFTLRLGNDASLTHATPGEGRFLDTDRPEDMRVILDAAAVREPVSRKAGVLDTGYLLGFHAMHGFGERFYWVRRTAGGRACPPGTATTYAATDWLIVCHEADGILFLHDVLATRMPSLRQVLSAMPHGVLDAVSFGFTPDRFCSDADAGTLEIAPRDNEDAFFIKSAVGFSAPPFLYPPIALA